MTPQARLELLNQVLKHSTAAPFYRSRLDGRPLASLEELNRLPLLTREDLQRHSPFGLVCVPREELYQYHESFGTTGAPVSTWLTREDLDFCAEQLNASGINFTPADIVLIRFPYAISTISHLVHHAAHVRGAAVVPASSRSTISPFPRIVNLLQKLEVTVLAGLPLQALLIAETAEMMGIKPARDFPRLRALFTGGESISPGRRQLLSRIWGVPVIDNYGMTELGPAVMDCQFSQPHPLEDYFIFEILKDDLQTGAEPGETGFLVVTTLRRKAVPLIRYLTRDRARLVPRECRCGCQHILEIRGRLEDTISIGGRVFDRWDVETIISHLPYQRYWAAGPDSKGLRIVVEEEGAGGEIDPGLISQLEDLYQLPLKVETVPPGTLCDRSQLMEVGEVGKPRYLYSAEEISKREHLRLMRL